MIPLNSRFDSPAPRKSPCVSGARGSAEILNVARSARTPVNFEGLKPSGYQFHVLDVLPMEFRQNHDFHKIHDLHHHELNLEATQTFYQKFFRSSRFQNLNPHVKLWYWTNGNRKRPTGSRAQTKNVKFSNQTSWPKSWPTCPRPPWNNIIFQARF